MLIAALKKSGESADNKTDLCLCSQNMTTDVPVMVTAEMHIVSDIIEFALNQLNCLNVLLAIWPEKPYNDLRKKIYESIEVQK